MMPEAHLSGVQLAWRIVRWPLPAVALLSAALLVTNATDEKLSTQARAMLATPESRYPDSENLFVLLGGLDAPAEKSPLAVGEANIAAYRRVVTEHLPLRGVSALEVGRTPKSAQLTVTTDLSQWNMLTSSIWERSRASHLEIAVWTSANRVLLDRYSALTASKGYEEEALRSSIELFYSVAQSLRALYLADIANTVQSGTNAERLAAIKSLAADVALWQRMLQGEGTLISKMIATAYLHADFILVADMIEDRTVPLGQTQHGAAELLEPWPVESWKIGKVFRTEFRRSSAVLADAREDPEHFLHAFDPGWDWVQRRSTDLGRLFVKQNATRNLQARILDRLSAVADGDPARYSENARTYVDWFEQLPSWSFPALLYNPIGKSLVDLGGPPFLDYPLRTFDVAAFQRLVVVAYQLRAQSVAPADVPGFMAAHPEWSTHLVDRTPFAWDAETEEIRVIPRAKSPPGRRFSIRIVR
jgi:hypothetical protein